MRAYIGATMLLEEANAAYAALRKDPEAWQELQAELADWETLSDGLPEEEPTTEEEQTE